jgi:hypothetical protein
VFAVITPDVPVAVIGTSDAPDVQVSGPDDPVAAVGCVGLPKIEGSEFDWLG